MYYNRDEYVHHPFVSHPIARNLFMEIKRYIHLEDNDKIIIKDKLYKVCALIETLNIRLQQFNIFSEHQSTDEEMVTYYGNHSAKMFMRGKPIPFGYILWVLASATGYPFNIEVYCGQTTNE